MTSPHREVDLVILGGGLLGTFTALLAAEDGYAPLVLRLSDEDTPNADSLRNHGWLQSGLLYADWPLDVVGAMRAAGLQMFELLSLPPPREPGVFAVADDESAEQFMNDAKRLRLSGSVERLSDSEAVRLLDRTIYEPQRPYFLVPDTTFSVASLLAAARDAARYAGADFIDLAQPARVVTDGHAPAGLLAEADSETLAPRQVVLAAGAANVEILNALGVSHQLQISRSPLLVVHDGSIPGVPIYVDRESSLAIARHSPSAIPPIGRLVVGNRHREPIAASNLRCARATSRIAQESIFRAIPARLAGRLSAAAARFTAGLKTEWRKHRPPTQAAMPWVSRLAAFPHVVAAIPGKATMSLYVARDIVNHLSKSVRLDSRQPHSLVADLGRRWTSRPHSHHEPFYDHMDDCAAEDDEDAE